VSADEAYRHALRTALAEGSQTAWLAAGTAADRVGTWHAAPCRMPGCAGTWDSAEPWDERGYLCADHACRECGDECPEGFCPMPGVDHAGGGRCPRTSRDRNLGCELGRGHGGECALA
jgi:hypothetical protein